MSDLFDAADADIVILTTCAFLKSAVAEAESSIRKLLSLKRRNPSLKVVVAGCLVQRYGADLPRRFPEIDLWVGLNELLSIPELLRRHVRLSLTAPPCHLPGAGNPRLLSTPRHYAYLKIADGCDNRCSYCTIPAIRGRFRSRPIPDLIAEAESLAQLGVRELILIAQDTTMYGTDIYGRPSLARLLDRLARIPAIRWLRLMYAHPAHLTADVIEQFASNPKLCRYLDLPIQHIADPILGKMHRHYRRQDIERLLARLRAIPDLHIRTTIITGFPGETRQAFRELLDFIKQARFDRLSGYPYSAEPGTPAYRFRPRVRPAVSRSRLRRIMQVQALISRANLGRLIGRELAVIVDSAGLGRTQWDAPEVDGVVRLTGSKLLPGKIVRCRITRAGTHDLHARVIGPETVPQLCPGRPRLFVAQGLNRTQPGRP